MIKPVLRLVTVLLVLGMLLAGCQSAQNGADLSPTSDPSPQAGGGESPSTQLTVWVREQVGAPLEQAMSLYKQQAPGVDIQLTQYPDQQIMDQFTLALSSNSAPDIMSMDDVFAPYFSSLGGFADITQWFEQLPFRDTFNSYMTYLGSYDGVQYGVPFTPDLSALLYNKAHFREAGLDPEKGPVTWDDLREYAVALTNEDRYGYVYGGGSGGGLMFTFMPYIWGNGGSYLNKDGTQAVIDSPAAVEALQFYYDLTNTWNVCPQSAITYSYGEAMDAFLTGKASMVILGNANVFNIVKDSPEFELGVCLIPKNAGKEHSSFIGGDVLAITQQCTDKEAAWQFIEFMVSDTVQVEVLAKNGSLPARSDLYDNVYFNEIGLLSVFEQAMVVGSAEYTLKYSELYNPLMNGFQAAMSQQLSPQQAFEKAAQEVGMILQ